MRSLKIFFDGGARPNPGTMEAAVVARGRLTLFPDLGHGTNNDGECRALIEAAKIAITLGIDDVILCGDSKFVIAQAARLTAYQIIIAPIGRVRLRHVRRGQNLAGIALDALHNR
jgi:ribonuclease HI